MDGAQLGRNDWWRYGLAFILFIGGYLGSVIVLARGLEAGYGALSALFPEHFSQQPFAYLLDLDVGWPDAPLLSGLYLFSSLMMSIIIAIPVLWIVVVWVHRRPFSGIFGWNGFDWRMFRRSFAAASVGCSLAAAVGVMLFWSRLVINSDWVNFISYLLVAVVLVPLQVLAEELVFRGYILQSVSMITKRSWLRICIPALTFAFLHYDSIEVQTAPVFAMGYFVMLSLYITWFAVRSGGIAAAVGFHLALNMFAAFVIITSLSPQISPTTFYIDAPAAWALPLEIIFVIAVHHALMKRWRVL